MKNFSKVFVKSEVQLKPKHRIDKSRYAHLELLKIKQQLRNTYKVDPKLLEIFKLQHKFSDHICDLKKQALPSSKPDLKQINKEFSKKYHNTNCDQEVINLGPNISSFVRDFDHSNTISYHEYYKIAGSQSLQNNNAEKDITQQLLEIYKAKSDVEQNVIYLIQQSTLHNVQAVKELMQISNNTAEFIKDSLALFKNIADSNGIRILLQINLDNQTQYYAVKSPGCSQTQIIDVDLNSKTINLPNDLLISSDELAILYNAILADQVERFGDYDVKDPIGDGNCMFVSLLASILPNVKPTVFNVFKNFIVEKIDQLEDQALKNIIDQLLQGGYQLHQNFSKVEDMYGILLMRAAIITQQKLDIQNDPTTWPLDELAQDQEEFINLVKGGKKAGYMHQDAIEIFCKILHTSVSVVTCNFQGQKIVEQNYGEEFEGSDVLTIINCPSKLQSQVHSTTTHYMCVVGEHRDVGSIESDSNFIL